MDITDTRMIKSPTNHGRRSWMKQAITGSVAAGLTGFVPRDATTLEAAADDTRVATPDKGVVETTAGKVYLPRHTLRRYDRRAESLSAAAETRAVD